MFPLEFIEFIRLLLEEQEPAGVSLPDDRVEKVTDALVREYEVVRYVVVAGSRFLPQITVPLSVVSFVLLTNWTGGDDEQKAAWVFRALDRVLRRSGLAIRGRSAPPTQEYIEFRFAAEISPHMKAGLTVEHRELIAGFIPTYYEFR
jgi:hypothetical protein